MHSLKRNGDNIAQEFMRLVNKGSMTKVAMDLFEDNDKPKDSVTPGGLTPPPDGQMTIGEDDAEALIGEMPEPTTDDILAMLQDAATASSADQSMGKGMAAAIDNVTAYNSDETRILNGLEKIASDLRGKGEGFAADVVEATSNSIKDDLRQSVQKRAFLISGLKKIAEDLYRSNDPLAGDMVAVTIAKLGGDSLEG